MADNFVPLAGEGDVWADMEAEGTTNSQYYTPEVGKINQVLVLTDPVKGMTNYKSQQEQRVQFQQFVAVLENGKPTDIKVWGIKSKEVFKQLPRIVKENGLSSLVGSVLQIVAAMKQSKSGTTYREYTVLLVQKPTSEQVKAVLAQFSREMLKTVDAELEAKAPQARIPNAAPVQAAPAAAQAAPVGATQ